MSLNYQTKLRHQAICMISVGLENKNLKILFSRKIIMFAIFLSDTVFLPYNQL